MVSPVTEEDRRPLKSRSWWIFRQLAAWLADRGISPNAISASSIFFAALGALGLVLTKASDGGAIVERLSWGLAIVGIQGRLIANLLDGMVAVEGGQGSVVGQLYNEVPDRISDPILLIAAGYAAGSSPIAGWTAAVLALLVAYVRAIAASAGCGQLFLGPMAKPQRMAVLTIVCVGGLILPSAWIRHSQYGPMHLGLLLIAAGCAVTVIRRLRRAGSFLRASEKLNERP